MFQLKKRVGKCPEYLNQKDDANYCYGKKGLELLGLRREGLARDNLKSINLRRVLDVCF